MQGLGCSFVLPTRDRRDRNAQVLGKRPYRQPHCLAQRPRLATAPSGNRQPTPAHVRRGTGAQVGIARGLATGPIPAFPLPELRKLSVVVAHQRFDLLERLDKQAVRAEFPIGVHP